MNVKDTGWVSFSSFSTLSFNLIKISILARILSPQDFGIMATVNLITGFLIIFMDLGMTTALYHKKEISKLERSSVFIANGGISILIGVILVLIRNSSKLLLDDETLPDIILMISIIFLSEPLGRVHKTLLLKDLKFKTVSIIEVTSSFMSLVLALILAYLQFGVFSLVYSFICQSIIQNSIFFIIGNVSSSYRVNLQFSYEKSKTFLKIGLYQTGSQMINYFSRDFDIILIGKTLGANILGEYSLSKQLVNRPLGLINPVINKMASPLLSKVNSHPSYMKKTFLQILGLTGFLNFSAYLLIIVFAEPFVSILYGRQYLNISSVVRVLGIYMFLRSILNPVSNLIIASGKTYLEFYWNLTISVVLPISMILGIKFGLLGLAFGCVLSMFILMIFFINFIVKKLIDISIWEFIKASLNFTGTINFIFKYLRKY